MGTEEYKSFSLAILSVVTEVSAYGCPFVSWSVEQNDGAGEALFFQGCFPGDQSSLTPLADTVLVICIISENFEKYCSLGFFYFWLLGQGWCTQCTVQNNSSSSCSSSPPFPPAYSSWMKFLHCKLLVCADRGVVGFAA